MDATIQRCGADTIQPATLRDEVKIALLELFRDGRGVRGGLFCEVRHRLDFNRMAQKYGRVATQDDVEETVNELFGAGLIEPFQIICEICKAYGYSTVDHAPAFKLTAAGHRFISGYTPP